MHGSRFWHSQLVRRSRRTSPRKPSPRWSAISAKALPDARSSATLGAQRRGAGALIGEGYVLTIGYLVIEAEAIQVTGADGRTVPATLAGYDHASGFGLLKLAAPLAGKPLPLGDIPPLGEREPALVATTSAREGVEPGLRRVAPARSPAAGNTSSTRRSSPTRRWTLVGRAADRPAGRAARHRLADRADAGGAGTQSPGNMFVPVDLLKPILADLMKSGRRGGPPRPWLGVNADEVRGRVFVSRVSPEGPSEKAGLQRDDIVLSVGGEEVKTLAEFYRRVWARGAAGVEVPIRVLRGAQITRRRRCARSTASSTSARRKAH